MLIADSHALTLLWISFDLELQIFSNMWLLLASKLKTNWSYFQPNKKQ